MGFSGSVNGTTKNPGFLDFGFCQCNWAYSIYRRIQGEAPPPPPPPGQMGIYSIICIVFMHLKMVLKGFWGRGLFCFARKLGLF